MNKENTKTEKQDELQPSSNSQNQLENRVYHTPKLIRYGGLAELVQNRPNRAMDGGVVFPDCTLT